MSVNFPKKPTEKAEEIMHSASPEAIKKSILSRYIKNMLSRWIKYIDTKEVLKIPSVSEKLHTWLDSLETESIKGLPLKTTEEEFYRTGCTGFTSLTSVTQQYTVTSKDFPSLEKKSLFTVYLSADKKSIGVIGAEQGEEGNNTYKARYTKDEQGIFQPQHTQKKIPECYTPEIEALVQEILQEHK